MQNRLFFTPYSPQDPFIRDCPQRYSQVLRNGVLLLNNIDIGEQARLSQHYSFHFSKCFESLTIKPYNHPQLNSFRTTSLQASSMNVPFVCGLSRCLDDDCVTNRQNDSPVKEYCFILSPDTIMCFYWCCIVGGSRADFFTGGSFAFRC